MVTMASGRARPMVVARCRGSGEVPWTVVKLTVCSSRAEEAHGLEFVG